MPALQAYDWAVMIITRWINGEVIEEFPFWDPEDAELYDGWVEAEAFALAMKPVIDKICEMFGHCQTTTWNSWTGNNDTRCERCGRWC